MAKQIKRQAIVDAGNDGACDATGRLRPASLFRPFSSPSINQEQGCDVDHTNDRTSSSQKTAAPTLGDRFHALPPEIRAEIFAILLVRPVKWQLPHQKDSTTCPPTQSPWNSFPPYPNINDVPNATCVRCLPRHLAHARPPLWRALQDPDPNIPDTHEISGGLGRTVWQHPWRSTYATPVQNPFLCSRCWDQHLRPRPHPAEHETNELHLRCLCARRQNLHIRLVSRQWNAEAGTIFYTRNTFAFESAHVLKNFLLTLPSHWKGHLTRVNLMAYRYPDPRILTFDDWESTRQLRPALRQLNTLSHLSHLELDATFLTRPSLVYRLLKLSHRNLRVVRFLVPSPGPDASTEDIWPRYRHVRVLVGGFAEEVARGLKGQRSGRWLLKWPDVLADACGRQKEALERLRGLDVGNDARMRVVESVEVWSGI